MPVLTKLIIFSLGVLLTSGCKAIPVSENSINSTLTTDVLSCGPENELFLDLYHAGNESIYYKKELPTVRNNSVVFSGISLSGIKKISYGHKTRKIPDLSQIVMKDSLLHFDMDTTTLGVRFLRLSIYKAQAIYIDDTVDFESDGFYFIIKGDVESAKSVLQENGVNVDMRYFEATKGGNTRLYCVMAG